MVIVHVQPFVELPGQVGVLTVACNVGAAQFQLSVMLLAPPETVIVALAGQTISGIKTVAVMDWPGGKEPLFGLIVMPFTPLLIAVHAQFVWLFALAIILRGQLQPLPAA